MITRDLILAQMRALLRGHGCLDAAAAAINARWGESVCKGTLSRRAHGEQPWPLHHVIALETRWGAIPSPASCGAGRRTSWPARTW